MKHQDIYRVIEQEAPLSLAEKWDHVGHAIGDAEAETTGVVLCLDLMPSTIALAQQHNCNLIISHHPQFFNPLEHIRQDRAEEAQLLRLIKNEIALYSAHTNLDASQHGVAYQLLKTCLTPAQIAETDINILEPKQDENLADRSVGHGRWVELGTELSLTDLYTQVTHALKAPFCRLTTDQNRKVKKVCFCPGAFAEEWISLLEAEQIDTLVTGEMKHNVGISLELRNISALVTGHDTNERVVLPYLQQLIQSQFPSLHIGVDMGLQYDSLLAYPQTKC